VIIQIIRHNSRWAIEEGRWKLQKRFGQMRRQRFYTENFGWRNVRRAGRFIPSSSAATAAQCGRFACDKSVDPLLRNFVDFRAGAAGNDPDCSSFSFGPNMKAFYGDR